MDTNKDNADEDRNSKVGQTREVDTNKDSADKDRNSKVGQTREVTQTKTMLIKTETLR